MSLYLLEGLKPWVIQRVSAVYISLFLLYVFYALATIDVVSYAAWHDWLFQPFNSIASGLFVGAILFHAWIGMRDVVLDYVHNIMWRIFVLAMIMSVLLASGMWVIRIIFLNV